MYVASNRVQHGVKLKRASFGFCIQILFKKIPSALIVPISINNSWKMYRYGKFPMGIGAHLTFTVHEPINLATFTNKEDLIKTIETTIKNNIHP